MLKECTMTAPITRTPRLKDVGHTVNEAMLVYLNTSVKYNDNL